MPKSVKSLFSPKDLFELADSLINLYTRSKLVLDFAKMENDQARIDAFSPLVWELELLIKTYGLKELVKID